MPSLTRTEAVERAALLTVRQYHIDLDLTRGAEAFGSTTRVLFSAGTPGASTFVEVQPRTLHSATLNGRDLDVASLVDGRLALPDLAADNELVVVADMAYSHEGQGLHRYVDPADGNVYLYAQSAVDQAPRILACFDQPDLKATYTFTVTAPDDWRVLGTGPATLAEGRWHLAETAPLSTYLVALVAGPYHSVYREHDGVPLGLHCKASLAAHLDADELFEITGQCLDEFHRLFGVRYPFGKYDQVFVPEFNVLAMENPGLVSIRDSYVFRSEPSSLDREDRAVVIAHEMSHMWFGNLVTMAWWDDLWLNEAFADSMGHRVAAEVTRYKGALTTFAAARKGEGYAADQRPSTHPVSADVPDTQAGLLNFDRISYYKGSSVVRQLTAVIGEEAVRAGLRTYFSRHAFANTSYNDFLAALGEAAGTDLSGWAAVWLREAQVNTLTPEITVADGRIVAAAVRQTAPASHPVLRPHTLDIGLYGPATEVVRIAVDGERTELPELVGRPAPEFVLLNDGDLTYAKIRFDPASLAALPTVLPTLSGPNRATVWGALLLMAQDGALPATGYLDLAVGALEVEPEFTIVNEILTRARTEIIDRYLDPADRDAALLRLADACRKLLAGLASGDDRLVTTHRALVECSTDVAELRGWLAGSPDEELGWRIRYRLAILGDLTPEELAGAFAADPGAQVHEARCRAAFPTAEAKRAAWDAITGDGELSNYAVWALAEGFWQPEQLDLTEPYVERFFTELPAAATLRGDQVLDILIKHLYPRYAARPATVALAEALLARDDVPAPLRRKVVDLTDDLRRAVAAREGVSR
ncbi:aminopeptidase N [Longispora sp. K20-0274]|uniref:aminopeptidase N n=1 Tax=Longispora sp. K20-0274 TaxID=3088255 RepID=UPI00399B3FB5